MCTHCRDGHLKSLFWTLVAHSRAINSLCTCVCVSAFDSPGSISLISLASGPVACSCAGLLAEGWPLVCHALRSPMVQRWANATTSSRCLPSRGKGKKLQHGVCIFLAIEPHPNGVRVCIILYIYTPFYAFLRPQGMHLSIMRWPLGGIVVNPSSPVGVSTLCS